MLGAAFYVMDMIDGQGFDDPQLLEVSIDQRRAIYSEMNRVLVEIHTVDLTATGLDDYGAPGNYFRRQTDRWSKQYKATETERISDMDDLMIWLDQNMPEDDCQRSLVHGDTGSIICCFQKMDQIAWPFLIGNCQRLGIHMRTLRLLSCSGACQSAKTAVV